MKNQSPQNLFDHVASLANNLSSPARLKLLYLVSQAPRSVEALSQLTGESVANTSQHLQRLLREGLVLVQKEKLSRIYRLSDERVALLVEKLFDVAELFSPPASEEAVTLYSIFEDIEAKKAILIDVRDEHEVQHTPIEGALSLPLEDIDEQIKKLKKSKTYYVFCRGRACPLAGEAVMKLRSKGFQAFRLKESPLSIKDILK